MEKDVSLRILTLGQFRIEWRSGEDVPWRTIADPAWQERSLRAAIACLLSQEKRACERGVLLEALWPGLDAQAANTYLERTLGLARRLMDPSGRREPRCSSVLQIDKDLLALADQGRVWVDADAFEGFLQEASTQQGGGEQERLLREAVSLYRGDFVPDERSIGLILTRRGTLRRWWMGALRSLAEVRKEHGDREGAGELLERLMGSDPTHEPAPQLLVDTRLPAGRGGVSHPPKTGDPSEGVRFPLSSLRQEERYRSHTLVGREQELNTLLDLLHETEEQRTGRCVLLLGRVGIGKTRLAEEVGMEAQRRGWLVVWSRVYPQESAISYHVWQEVLRKGRGNETRTPGRLILPQLRELSLFGDPSLPQSEREPSGTWKWVEESLVEVSERVPLLVVLDDLHWADEASCRLLEYLVPRLGGRRILVVGTCRDDELAEGHAMRSVLAHLCDEGSGLLLPVPSLTSGDTRSLVTGYSPGTEALVDQIVHYAAGIPLFAEELARVAADAPAGDELFFPPTISGSPSEHPPSFLSLSQCIIGVLQLRLDRLSAPCRLLLSKSLSLGHSFTLRDVLSLEKATGGMRALDSDRAIKSLDEAVREGILAVQMSEKNLTYRVVFPLLADYLSQRISAGRRRYYRRIVEQIMQEQGEQ